MIDGRSVNPGRPRRSARENPFCRKKRPAERAGGGESSSAYVIRVDRRVHLRITFCNRLIIILPLVPLPYSLALLLVSASPQTIRRRTAGRPVNTGPPAWAGPAGAWAGLLTAHSQRQRQKRAEKGRKRQKRVKRSEARRSTSSSKRKGQLSSPAVEACRWKEKTLQDHVVRRRYTLLLHDGVPLLEID